MSSEATAVSLSGKSTLGKSKKTCDLETFLHVAQQSKEMMWGRESQIGTCKTNPRTSLREINLGQSKQKREGESGGIVSLTSILIWKDHWGRKALLGSELITIAGTMEREE